jgi:putative tryptophan/tyrosine transport system substrate-binding protein
LSNGVGMRRRDFITLLGGAAAAWPLVTQAQQPATPVVGWLGSADPKGQALNIEAFIAGLRETGYVEGRNVAMEYRWAEDQFDRLPVLAGDLVRQRVAMILANAPPAAVAAKAATSTIPIVFVVGFDPVAAGLVSSLNRPGGNLTGMSLYIGGLVAKKLEILGELIPKSAAIGLVVHPKSPTAATDIKDAQAAAKLLGRRVEVFNVENEVEIDAAFELMAGTQIGGVLIGTDALFVAGQTRLILLEARYKIPVLHYSRGFPVAGGLVSYGSNLADLFRQAGIYSGRILKGAKPEDLPVVQPTKFELVINLKAAKALGLVVPSSLMARADEVIE